jgi:hypothetical protein
MARSEKLCRQLERLCRAHLERSAAEHDAPVGAAA